MKMEYFQILVHPSWMALLFYAFGKYFLINLIMTYLEAFDKDIQAWYVKCVLRHPVVLCSVVGKLIKIFLWVWPNIWNGNIFLTNIYVIGDMQKSLAAVLE